MSGASPAIPNPAHYQVARNVNFNLRKPQQGVLNVQYRTPSDKYFGGSTVSDINKEYNNLAGTALDGDSEKRPQDRGLLRASQEFGKNPITGEGHVSWDEADRDLDGRHGAGSRGATGNRTSNCITGRNSATTSSSSGSANGDARSQNGSEGVPCALAYAAKAAAARAAAARSLSASGAVVVVWAAREAIN